MLILIIFFELPNNMFYKSSQIFNAMMRMTHWEHCTIWQDLSSAETIMQLWLKVVWAMEVWDFLVIRNLTWNKTNTHSQTQTRHRRSFTLLMQLNSSGSDQMLQLFSLGLCKLQDSERASELQQVQEVLIRCGWHTAWPWIPECPQDPQSSNALLNVCPCVRV